MSKAASQKTIPELYEDVAREYDLKSQRETSPAMKSFYVGLARENRQRANEWRRISPKRENAA
jgi:hypothetical protein